MLFPQPEFKLIACTLHKSNDTSLNRFWIYQIQQNGEVANSITPLIAPETISGEKYVCTNPPASIGKKGYARLSRNRPGLPLTSFSEV